MGRRTFDTLISATGLLLAILLAIVGGLLTWGSGYVNDEVTGQLAAQNITFPPADSEAVAGPEYAPMRKYGGKQLTTGDQAKVYAENFIGVHLDDIGGGKTYSELSEEAKASPDDAELEARVESMFRGETLRGLLLNAYAFDKIGSIAQIASIVSYVGALLLLLMAGLGFRNARIVPPGKPLLEPREGADEYPS